MIASQVVTPTIVQVAGGRIGVCVYDNPLVTDNSKASAYVIFADSTWIQEDRNDLTVVPGTGTGPSAFAPVEGTGPGN